MDIYWIRRITMPISADNAEISSLIHRIIQGNKMFYREVKPGLSHIKLDEAWAGIKFLDFLMYHY